MKDKFRALCEQYYMLPPGSRVLCACSGGADSTALLHLLCATPGIEVVCAHFNHCLRGAESERDEKAVRALCEALGVECTVGRGDVAAYAREQHIGQETAARRLRYAFLRAAARERRCDRIATAHHAEDNAETILMHLIRGSGAAGLRGIPPVRGQIIRPLLRATRAEILAYLNENGLQWVEDSSNASDGCARNRIRHAVLPLLEAENPNAVAHICAAGELLRRDEEYFTALAERFIETQSAPRRISAPALSALPESVSARVVRILCGPIPLAATAAVAALAAGPARHASLDVPGMRIRRSYDVLLFGEAEAPPLRKRELPPGRTPIPELGLCAVRRPLRPGEEIHNSFNTFYFKNDSIRGKMYLAAKNDGDRVRLLGRGCTKTLKKLFSEAAVPPEERLRIPVLSDDGGVAAVYGFGIAERCAAAEADGAECVEFLAAEEISE